MKLTVGTHEQGYIIVTNDAILSVLSKSQLEAGGGAISAAIGRTMERRKAEAAPQPSQPIAKLSDLMQVHECKVSELPRALVSAPGFPRVEGFRSVTIYPKRIVQAVKASIWRGLVVTVNNQPAPMAVQMWQVGKMRKHLTEAGYRMG